MPRSARPWLAATAAVVFVFAQVSLADLYRIDPEHSEIGFSIRHLDVGNLRGRFNEFEGEITMNGRDTSSIKARITIQAASINTHHPGRDEHLREGEFFDVAKHPEIMFESTQVRDAEEGSFTLDGKLTMMGKTLPLSLRCVFSGPRTDPWKKKRIGLSLSAEIDRMAYGMVYNKTMSGKDPQVGHVATAMIEIEAVQKRAKK